MPSEFETIWRFNRSRSVALGQSWTEYTAAMRAHEEAIIEWAEATGRARDLHNVYVNISYDSVVAVFTDRDTALLAKISIVADEQPPSQI